MRAPASCLLVCMQHGLGSHLLNSVPKPCRKGHPRSEECSQRATWTFASPDPSCPWLSRQQVKAFTTPGKPGCSRVQLEEKGAPAFSKTSRRRRFKPRSLPPSLLPQREATGTSESAAEAGGARACRPGTQRRTGRPQPFQGPQYRSHVVPGQASLLRNLSRGETSTVICPLPAEAGSAFHLVRFKMAAPMVRCGMLLARQISTSRLSLAGW